MGKFYVNGEMERAETNDAENEKVKLNDAEMNKQIMEKVNANSDVCINIYKYIFGNNVQK